MKAIILAGGTGSRLSPLTKITNKHLLPVYNKPMIYYPIETMANAGIEEVMIVTGGNHAGEFLRLLGNGKAFGLKDIAYSYQEKAGGIAEALGLAENFAKGEKVVVMLGDNIIHKNIRGAVAAFRKQKKGARIILKEVENPQAYGVAEMKDGRILRIEEKPKVPKSNHAVIGIYMFPPEVFKIIKTLKPSHRGELEITDVNNAFIRKNAMEYSILNGWWCDAGETIDTYLKTCNMVAQSGANQE